MVLSTVRKGIFMKKNYTAPTLKILGQLTVITQESKEGSTFDNKDDVNNKNSGQGEPPVG